MFINLSNKAKQELKEILKRESSGFIASDLQDEDINEFGNVLLTLLSISLKRSIGTH